MRPTALLLLCALLLPGGLPPAAAAADPPEKLRDTVLEGAFQDEMRLKSAAALAQANPEMLGGALLELGEKRKDPRHLGFLVKYTCAEEVRHLRMLAAWSAWQCAPEGVLAAYIEKTASDDEKTAVRAIEAVGLVAPVLKDRTSQARLLEIAKAPRVIAGIEAARALNRTMDRRLLKDLFEAVCATPEDHVRKHLVWALLDLEKESAVSRTLSSLQGRPGQAGKNAAEGVRIVEDKQSTEFEWKPLCLKDVPDWWKTGRPRDGKVEIAINDPDLKAKIQSFLDDLGKEAPAWKHLLCSAAHRIARNDRKVSDLFDLKTKSLLINVGDIAKCESPWQGAYVLARGACIAVGGTFGEPMTGHRGWEPGYVDIHSFYRTTKHPVEGLADFVESKVKAKPWD